MRIDPGETDILSDLLSSKLKIILLSSLVSCASHPFPAPSLPEYQVRRGLQLRSSKRDLSPGTRPLLHHFAMQPIGRAYAFLKFTGPGWVGRIGLTGGAFIPGLLSPRHLGDGLVRRHEFRGGGEGGGIT